MKTKHSLDRYFTQNVFSISGAEFLWGLALPIIAESTFLQLYLRSINASETMIGLIPAIMATGMALFSPVSAMFTSHLQHKKTAVVIAHCFASLPWFIYGLILLFSGSNPGPGMFLIIYALFTAVLGVTVPVWQTYLVKIFSPEKTFSALSIMLVTQITARMAGGLIIAGAVQKLSFSQTGAAAVFTAAGFCFFSGGLFFIISHEDMQTASSAREKKHTLRTLLTAGKQIFKNRSFMFFQLSTIETFASITVISFYATYAVEIHGISSAVAAGLFAVCIYAGGIISNLIFGSFNLLSLKNKLYISKVFAITSISVLLFAKSVPFFLTASFLIGLGRGINQLAFSPAVKKLSRVKDATDYFSVAPLIMVPFSFGIPALSGVVISHLHMHKETAYMGVFAAMALLIAVSMFFLHFIDFEE